MAATLSTVRALIYWEYAKLIAGEAVGQRDAFRFVNHTFRRLLEQRISPSAILRENQALFRAGEVCVYCGATEQLQWDHIVPLALGGDLPGNEIQSPMAKVILGGLISSTLLNAFIVPIIYEKISNRNNSGVQRV